MKNKSLFNILFHRKFDSRSDMYHFIGERVSHHSTLLTSEVVDTLLQREQAGNIQIAEHVLLPHFESSKLKESQIVVVHLHEGISKWNQHVSDIKLVIFILLKRDETLDTKKEITNFMRNLADQDYIEKLLHADSEESFTQMIIQ